MSIAAASIMAKEYRDDLMKEIADEYPGYEFEKMWVTELKHI